MKKRIQDQQFQIDLLKTQLEVISLLLRIQNFKAEIIVPNIGSIIVRFFFIVGLFGEEQYKRLSCFFKSHEQHSRECDNGIILNCPVLRIK